MLRDPDSERPWIPRADVFVNSVGEFTIKVELAALRRDDIELNVDGRRFRVTGHRPDADRTASGSQYLVAGINWGWFDLVVEVPPGFDLTKATAIYQNGLLRVQVPQAT